MEGRAPKAFISYSHRDRAEIVPLASYLDRLGLEVWMDTKDLQAGESIVEAVSEAISVADLYVICLSPASVDSPWVRHELQIALTLETQRGKPKVLPVLLANTDIPAPLTGRLYIDASEPDAGRREIHRFVRSNLSGISSKEVEGEPGLTIASIELELSAETVRSYGGANPEVTKTEVEREADALVQDLRRRANGVLMNFVPVSEIDLNSSHFQFPNGEISTRTEDREGELAGTLRKRIVTAVQVLNPKEDRLEELVSSKLESLGVTRAIYTFVLDPPVDGLGRRALERLQKRHVLLGWDQEHGADIELEDGLTLSVLVSDEQVRIGLATQFDFQFDDRAKAFSVRDFVKSLISES